MKRKIEGDGLEMTPERETSRATLDPEVESANGSQNGDATEFHSVLIVGAGPAGLMLASNLVRFGIDVEIIDDREDKTSTGRADGLQPKTIETFRQLRLADGLLKKGVKIYDICFWNSTPTSPMSRTGREIHYPQSVETLDPYVLLVHQGMIEDVFLEDLKIRGAHVTRSSRFVKCTSRDINDEIESTYRDVITGEIKTIRSNYVIGCDGAHSKVRKSMPGVTMEGQSGNAAWGVLDGVIETDFPDIWSKAVIHSQVAGSMLSIPRERNMTRLYIELHPGTTKPIEAGIENQEFVMRRAAEILHPFHIKWKSIEWFSVYRVGQRVATHFAYPSQGIFLVGDAAHTHSPKAAQGMNVSMHDAFNLAWKLNLVIRNITLPSLLDTYEFERRQIAEKLIQFDFEHANAFLAGDAQALAQNFDDNIRFISGVGAEYEGYSMLNRVGSGGMTRVNRSNLRPGVLLPPARVTRYIDANPVDIQLDIPLLCQFRIYFLMADIHASMEFLTGVSEFITYNGSPLCQNSKIAEKSYERLPVGRTEADEYLQPERYIGFSKVYTPAIVTTMKKGKIEIKDLPGMFKQSPWTLYLDNIGGQSGSCTDKWTGGLTGGEIGIINVRPDGYVGSLRFFMPVDITGAITFLFEYFGGFLDVEEFRLL